MQRTIFHIDVNSAFLSWEAVYRLKFLGEKRDIRNLVAAIGGDEAKRHGIILAKSIPSKKYGIQTGESLLEARKKCPQLLIFPPDYDLYEDCSRAFIQLLSRYTDQIEQYSIDECFLDVTDALPLFGDPLTFALRIKKAVYEELGFTVNIGISSCKLLAKMASDFRKPYRIHTLYREEIPSKLWPLPVGDLFYVGHATKNKLHKLGIHTIGELAHTDPELLQIHMKSHGLLIWEYANGIDDSPVIASPPPNKGYGNSTTTSFDVSSYGEADAVLLALCETVGMRLRRDQASGRVIHVGIRYQDSLAFAGMQTTLNERTCSTSCLYKTAATLLRKIWNAKTPLRHLGVHVGDVKYREAYRQMELFQTGADQEKQLVWERTVDQIRARYGPYALIRSSFLLYPDVDPNSGGISAEKRGIHTGE
uniref:DNA polymerase Y family protein n=1 Tax=Lachnoclostridium phocaeense TaxID=1871021 RepID=UPI0026DA9761|nr:DNA polymerase IV [Lachnoclostridium phocaeense]